ncbi:Uncharacterised protein [uncultured archaeon]|nr:Uncharacterised protein [uncultured archaeon]
MNTYRKNMMKSARPIILIGVFAAGIGAAGLITLQNSQKATYFKNGGVLAEEKYILSASDLDKKKNEKRELIKSMVDTGVIDSAYFESRNYFTKESFVIKKDGIEAKKD